MMKAMKIETSHIKERMDVRGDEIFQIFNIFHSFFKYFFSRGETLTFCVRDLKGDYSVFRKKTGLLLRLLIMD